MYSGMSSSLLGVKPVPSTIAPTRWWFWMVASPGCCGLPGIS